MARKLYLDEPFGVDLKETVYAPTTTIDLACRSFRGLSPHGEIAHRSRPAGSGVTIPATQDARSISAISRARRVLRHGPWLPGLRAPVPFPRGGQLLRDPRQVEPRPSVASRPVERIICDHPSPTPRPPPRLAGTPPRWPCDHRAVPLPLAGGAVLQMDQAASADQAVLWHAENRVKTHTAGAARWKRPKLPPASRNLQLILTPDHVRSKLNTLLLMIHGAQNDGDSLTSCISQLTSGLLSPSNEAGPRDRTCRRAQDDRDGAPSRPFCYTAAQIRDRAQQLPATNRSKSSAAARHPTPRPTPCRTLRKKAGPEVTRRRRLRPGEGSRLRPNRRRQHFRRAPTRALRRRHDAVQERLFNGLVRQTPADETGGPRRRARDVGGTSSPPTSTGLQQAHLDPGAPNMPV